MLSADDRHRCRCCRVPVFGARARFRVCPICDLCEDAHGADLHTQLHELHAAGVIDAWHFVASSALDDAWITGNVAIHQDGTLNIAKCPRRWEVWIAWSRVARMPIDPNGLVQGAICAWMGKANIAENRGAMQNEVEAALREAKSPIVGARLNFDNCTAILDNVRIDGLIPNQASAADVLFHDASIGVPDDIASKPRGSA